MAITFKKAVKTESKLRMALIGPSGSGKTYTSLLMAKELANGNQVAVIDTERGSASKYADLFEFDSVELESYNPKTFVEAIKTAERAGYAVIVIDSLSHAWMGKDGALELVDKAKARSTTQNSFTAWRDVTPLHNALIDAITGAKCHVIATMRAKQAYVMEETVNANGKKTTTPRKVGLEAIQRDGMEYEFDIVADMDLDNRMIVSKSRCPALSGAIFTRPGADVTSALKEWLHGIKPAHEDLEPATEKTSGTELPALKRRIVDLAASKHISKNAIEKRCIELYNGVSFDEIGLDSAIDLMDKIKAVVTK